MKKTLFYCNFCKEEINLGGTEGKQYGYGVHWRDDMLEVRYLDNTENHICSKCLVAIAQLESMIADSKGAQKEYENQR